MNGHSPLKLRNTSELLARGTTCLFTTESSCISTVTLNNIGVYILKNTPQGGGAISAGVIWGENMISEREKGEL
jgi:hypothetical protein